MMAESLEDKTSREFLYIANQQEGPFDEVQRVIMAYEQRKPILMGGDPGSGKTQLAKFLSRILGKPIHRIVCEPEKEVADLLGHETLIAVGEEGQQKATATGFKKGEMVPAMERGEIAYLDEFNKLRHGVQKGLNSILEDTSTYRIDGKEQRAHDETCYIMAYNPGTGTDLEDIEPAVFDRCEYIRFEDQPKDFQIRVAMVKAGLLTTDEIVDEDMEERAIEVIDEGGKKRFRFLVKGNDGYWYKYGKAERVEPQGKLHTYFFYKGSGDQKLTTDNERANRYYQVISNLAEFIHDVKEVIRKGSNALPDDFREALGISRFNKLEGHMPSFRLVISNVRKYISYTEQHDVEPELVMEQIAYDVINTVCAKIPSDQKVGKNITAKEMLRYIAMARGLLRREGYPDIPDLPSHY
ncbi:hypothetical protein D6745_01175 [Candidatus Woesearchaeota archaeon]|nr:MAG: hypothetical protein D6745_01175 [Candidatus Woesearchaeota archaeon]